MRRLFAAFLTLSLLPFAVGQPGTTTRVSVSSAGVEGDDFCRNSTLSGDGRYVAFLSRASTLVAGDTNGMIDIFVRDRQTAQTIRVSVSSGGVQANNNSTFPSISRDGRYIAFTSNATNLVANDTNNATDCFVYDMVTAETTLVSRNSSGTQGNLHSNNAHLSADGNFCTFSSDATNLVANDTNNQHDAFVHNRTTGETTRISLSSTGTQGNGISFPTSLSADGRFVAFESSANNLVAGDTNGFRDVFLHDRLSAETTRVSVSAASAQGNNSSYDANISGDGRYIVYRSVANNLVLSDTNNNFDVFLYDRLTGAVSMVSLDSLGKQGNRGASDPTISENGRIVSFASDSSGLVSGDTNQGTDLFVKDLLTGNLRRVSVSTSGGQAFLGGINYPAMSSDGRVVSFQSESKNLVPSDTNNESDIFVNEVGPTNELVGFTINVATLAGQNRTIGTVQMAFPAVLRSDVITIVNSNHLIMPAQITIDAGAMSKVFAIQAMPMVTTISETVVVRYGFQSETANLLLVPFVPSSLQ
ncbi:MAG: hypothetical protein ABL962_14680, partial [Fimbriimonadaceae bacterium]